MKFRARLRWQGVFIGFVAGVLFTLLVSKFI